MPKKKILTEEQISEKVEYLRKQRDGLIVGNYRIYLYKLYMYLKERCTESKDGSCNPYPWQMLVALGRDDLHKSYLGYEYCDDLEALGYIKMEGYVCVNQLGELMKPSYVTEHFAAIIQVLGLRKIRFHDLRHTFASVLINNDVPLINVSRFLGHSDISTTANIYAHLDKSNKQSSADVMTGVLGGKEGK